MNKYVVIVAGGKGLRMGEELPKQFIEINGKPVLMHTINAFYAVDPDIRIILVLPVSQTGFWEKLCHQYSFKVQHVIAHGGETRFHSVMNGLSKISTPGLVAVHDGVRPFVSQKVINTCYECACQHGSAVPVTEPVDSIRRIEGDKNMAVNRADYRLVQTPQVFDVDKLKKAYLLAEQKEGEFTDDAGVFSFAGHDIELVPGERENIKITTPFDLKLAKTIFETNGD